MPVHMSHTVRWGSEGRSVLLFAHDLIGSAVAGLSGNSPGAAAAYVREGEEPVAVGLTDTSLGEVDPNLAPGLYRLDLPDELFAAGSPHAWWPAGWSALRSPR